LVVPGLTEIELPSIVTSIVGRPPVFVPAAPNATAVVIAAVTRTAARSDMRFKETPCLWFARGILGRGIVLRCNKG
jgi:hypothetical protein